MRVTCILILHDAVELFLVLAGDHLGANLNPKLDFMGYWAEIKSKSKTNVQLTGKTAMDRLNRRRVDFKHHGNLPSTESLARACADVSTFFEDNTPLVFGIDYNAVDMADLIPQVTTRTLVKQAVALESSGQRTEAMGYLHFAFSGLYHQKIEETPQHLFAFGPKLEPRLSVELTAQALGGGINLADDRLAHQIERVTQATMMMQDGLRLIATGISYPEYARFMQYVPGHRSSADGAPEDAIEVAASTGYAATDEEYEFCLRFVINGALKLAELEAVMTPAWIAAPSQYLTLHHRRAELADRPP